jgi:hypothetical protein
MKNELHALSLKAVKRQSRHYAARGCAKSYIRVGRIAFPNLECRPELVIGLRVLYVFAQHLRRVDFVAGANRKTLVAIGAL